MYKFIVENNVKSTYSLYIHSSENIKALVY